MTVTNILAVFNNASEAEVESGLGWYAEANRIARDIAPTLEIGAGVIAALSPQNAWTQNVIMARRAFDQGEATGHLGDALRKANRILGGEPSEDVLGGLKVRSFYANIIDPEDPEPVTIDRHAFDVWLMTRADSDKARLSITPKRYRAAAQDYRDAAKTLGILPSALQAITWETWRNKYAWRKGATVDAAVAA